ncbi:2-dehydropantoate 2-reductase [Pseudacidovorax intermedius]|uniref:2-dehydropantoate 2-reductase n=1 Tax=Pseudacidovorax intermedius TaxID=433924 RepID=A0A147GNY7_9BURK|nr:2-dehydropantoate 2-reductase [Pseudacidovorax intermedius]KTT15381.1 2-dehydropantoate 2-reductase [Pseudacidovorax intermedius]
MKICIYGAGAIGGWIGTAFAQAGERLNVVARGATLAALQADGLAVVRQGGATQRVPVHAVDDPAALGPQDVVVIAVKAPALAGVAERIGPLLGPDTVVLTAMNGVPWWFLDGGFGGPLAGRRLSAVDPEGRIAAAIPGRHVIGGVVHASCSLDAPGVVRHHFGNGLILGEPSGTPTERVQRLAGLLQGGGIDARVSPQIQKDVWYKLWGNMTVNPISALTGATTDRILADDLLRGFISAVMLEARAVGERIGVPIAEMPEDRHAVTRKLGAFKTSMLQDVEAGRPVELDALVSAVRELAQGVDLPTPFTDALLGLARVQARGLGLY